MPRTKPYLTGIAISIVLAVVTAIGASRYIVPAAIVAWDEAANLLWGYRLYEALVNHDTRLFLSVSGNQVYYPPLQSWFMGFVSICTGFTVSIVRTYHLVWLLLIPPLLFHIGYGLDRKRYGIFIGLGASLLFVLSPMTFVFSGIALKEMMGTALTLLSYISYRRLEDHNRLRDAVSGGIFVLLLFYFKYNYALLLCVGYGVLTAIRLFSGVRSDRRPYIVFWMTTVTGCGLWIILQGQKLLSEYVLVQTPQTVGFGTLLQKVLFYPQSVLYEYAPNAGIGLIMLFAFCFSLRWFRGTPIRALWVVFLCYTVLLGLYTDNLHERYIFPVMPLLYALTAHAVVRLYVGLMRMHPVFSRILTLGILLALASTVVGVVRQQPDFAYSLGAHTLRSPIFNQPDYRDTLFDFDRLHWSHRVPPAGSEFPADVISYVMDVVGPSADIIVKGNINELSPKYWALSFLLSGRNRDANKSAPSDTRVVTVEVLPESRFFTRDYVLFNSESAAEAERIQMDNGYVKVDEKRFTDLGIVVRIFRTSPGII